jgi:GTP-binding protein EngB required for normal cell division
LSVFVAATTYGRWWASSHWRNCTSFSIQPRLAILLLDARRGWMEKDVQLRQWREAHQRPYVVAVTKTDKLKSQKERHQSQTALRDGYTGELLECSGLTGQGVREIWQAISKIQRLFPNKQ